MEETVFVGHEAWAQIRDSWSGIALWNCDLSGWKGDYPMSARSGEPRAGLWCLSRNIQNFNQSQVTGPKSGNVVVGFVLVMSPRHVCLNRCSFVQLLSGGQTASVPLCHQQREAGSTVVGLLVYSWCKCVHLSPTQWSGRSLCSGLRLHDTCMRC